MELIDVSLFSFPDSRGANQFIMLGGKHSDLEASTLRSTPCATVTRVFRTPEQVIAALAPLRFPQHRLDLYGKALRSNGSASFDLQEEQASLIGMIIPTQVPRSMRAEPERATSQRNADKERNAEVAHRAKQSVAA